MLILFCSIAASSFGAYLSTKIAPSGHLDAQIVHTWQYLRFFALAFPFILQISSPFGHMSLHSPQPVHFSSSTKILKIIAQPFKFSFFLIFL
jgi:hypothetical protein